MKALVVSNGTIENLERLNREVEKADFIISADGGMNHLIKINKKPNMVLGDLDSISEESLDFIEKNNIKTDKYPAIKDATDTELALFYLVEKGFEDITLMGVTGTRQDHSLANIFLLDKMLEKNIKCKIVDDNNTIYIIDDYLQIKQQEKSYISIIPISLDGIDVTLRGFYYLLDNVHIDFGSTHGVSNRIIEDYGRIYIHKGKAIVTISRD